MQSAARAKTTPATETMGARHHSLVKGGFARPPGGARPIALLCSLIIALATLLGATAAASAHASLLNATPVDGAVVVAAPALLTLRFSEPVTPLVLELVAPDNTSMRLDAVKPGVVVDVALPASSMRAGTYLVSWRVVSADGHPVGGTLTFSVGSPSAVAPTPPTLDNWALSTALWSARLALYLGLFFGAGSAFALAWFVPSSHHGSGTAAAFVGLGLVAVPVSFALQGLDALGAPLGIFGQAMTWQAAAATSYSFTAAIAFVALALAMLALVAEGALARWLSLGALVGTGAALAASGHASAAAPQWLTRPMVFIHGAGVAFWIGALLPLGLAYRRGDAHAGEALRRFSAAIPYVVAALIGAGVVLAVIQVENLSALWTTAYGRLLLAKLALAAVLLALAASNRWHLTKSALAGKADAQSQLVRNIAVETLVAMAILGLVAGFRFTPPPRVLAIEAAAPAAIHIHTADAMADLTITPGHAGKVSASIVVMTGDFGPLDARTVTLRLSNPQAGAASINASAYKPGDGTWRVDNLDLPVSGKWTVTIDIEIAEASRVTLNGDIAIRP